MRSSKASAMRILRHGCHKWRKDRMAQKRSRTENDAELQGRASDARRI